MVLVGCTSRQNDCVLVQSNDQLVYVNYPEAKEFELPYSFFEDYHISLSYSLDVKDLGNRILISKNDLRLVDRIIEKNSDRYLEHEKDRCLSDSTSQLSYFFCGRLSLVDSINSFLISEEVLEDIPEISTLRSLYLFNYKNKQITSIVQLSVNWLYGNSTSTIVTYVIDTYWPLPYYFSQINYSFSSDSDKYISIENYLSSQVVNEYIKVKKNLKVLYFSTFVVDENGFIKLIDI